MVAHCPTPNTCMRTRYRRRRLLCAAITLCILGSVYLCYTRFGRMSETPQIVPHSKSPIDGGGGEAPPKAKVDTATNTALLPLAQDGEIRMLPMAYGINARPALKDIIPLSTLSPDKLPTASSSRRLIIIGDVHGQLHELKALLSKAGYSGSRHDHVIFTGDMISKGPDSAGVVALAMEMGASSVRGNHEDRVLLAYENMKTRHVVGMGDGSFHDLKGTAAEDDDMVEPVLLRGDHADQRAARSLTAAQRSWLSQLPVILKVGAIPSYGEVVVVHAGLVPEVPLKDQDPSAVMNMRTLLYPAEQLRREHIKKRLEKAAIKKARKRVKIPDAELDAEMEASRARGEGKGDFDVALPTDGRTGRSWSEAWNEAQENKGEDDRMTVVYGHDAKTGLNLGKYTFGLDSNCVRGGRLTALIFEPDKTSGVTHRIVSVDCEKAQGVEAFSEKDNGKEKILKKTSKNS